MGGVKKWQDRLTNTTRVTKNKVVCFNGPWVGQTLCVSTLPTAWLCIGGKTGRYGKNGMWEEKNENSSKPDPVAGSAGNG